MSLDNIRVKEEVDKLFSTSPDNDSSLAQMRLQHESHVNHMTRSYANSPISSRIDAARHSLNSEDFTKVAEAAAKDDRLKPYLPSIALEAMMNNEYTAVGTANVRIGKPHEGNTEAELLSASKDTKRYDAISRTGLAFAANNYANFRNFNENDGLNFSWIGGDANSWKITEKDLETADACLNHTNAIPESIKANELMATNFTAIDNRRKNGKIDVAEAAAWAAQHPELIQPIKQAFSMEMPQIRNDALNYYTEELSPQDLQKRLSGLRADQIAMSSIKWKFE
jgi:hypothetical protein